MTEDRELVHVELTEHVLTITMDRPEARNALSRQMVAELTAAFDRLETDDEARSASSRPMVQRSVRVPI